MHFQIRKRWYKKFPPGPPPGPGGKTYDQHESLRLRRGVLQFTLPTSREHITLTHSHSRTYTPKDIIRTQKINLLGKNYSNSSYKICGLLHRWISTFSALQNSMFSICPFEVQRVGGNLREKKQMIQLLNVERSAAKLSSL